MIEIKQVIKQDDQDFTKLVAEEKSNFEEALLTHENFVSGDLPGLDLGWCNIVFIIYKDYNPAGYCRLHLARDGSGIVTPFLFIRKEYRNRGLGIILGSYSIDFCFTHLSTRKISFVCFSYNPALSIYKRYFTREGVRKKECLFKKKFYDKYLFCWFEKDYLKNKEKIDKLIYRIK